MAASKQKQTLVFILIMAFLEDNWKKSKGVRMEQEVVSCFLTNCVPIGF